MDSGGFKLFEFLPLVLHTNIVSYLNVNDFTNLNVALRLDSVCRSVLEEFARFFCERLFFSQDNGLINTAYLLHVELAANPPRNLTAKDVFGKTIGFIQEFPKRCGFRNFSVNVSFETFQILNRCFLQAKIKEVLKFHISKRHITKVAYSDVRKASFEELLFILQNLDQEDLGNLFNRIVRSREEDYMILNLLPLQRVDAINLGLACIYAARSNKPDLLRVLPLLLVPKSALGSAIYLAAQRRYYDVMDALPIDLISQGNLRRALVCLE